MSLKFFGKAKIYFRGNSRCNVPPNRLGGREVRFSVIIWLCSRFALTSLTSLSSHLAFEVISSLLLSPSIPSECTPERPKTTWGVTGPVVFQVTTPLALAKAAKSCRSWPRSSRKLKAKNLSKKSSQSLWLNMAEKMMSKQEINRILVHCCI